MKRVLAALPVLVLALGACAFPDLTPEKEPSIDPNTVQVDGVSFARPVGFREIDPDQLAAVAVGNADVADLAESMGMDPSAMGALLKSVDLYLVKQAGLQGYADNVSVSEPGGAMPGDKALKAQFGAIGAKAVKIGHVKTDLGKVTTATYTLGAGRKAVAGQAIVVDADDVVVISVSTGSRAATKALAKSILTTLDEA